MIILNSYSTQHEHEGFKLLKDRTKFGTQFVFRIHASANATTDKEKNRGSPGTVVKSVLVEERPLHSSKPNQNSLESQEEDNKPNEQTEVEDETTMSEKARD